MKKLLLIALAMISTSVMVAQSTISGVVSDASGPLPGANIKISRKAVGTTTDFDGNFTFKVAEKPPFTIEISSLGYQTQKIEITKSKQTVNVTLKENATALDEVVVSASRTPERVMESPVTIERFDSRAIKNTSSASFYDGLENLKGVDINSNSLTFKSVNTRGFASFANERFVQLVDGMDNSSPALNFALGNLLGLSELDVKTVEILPGASSALYGANAFNGIMLMTSKSPFDDQGISFVFKTGLTSQQAAGDNPFYDSSIRMAYAFDDKFAAKATLSYLKGEEWHATDYRNTSGVGNLYIPGNRNNRTDFDGVNIYGDEVAVNLREASGLGIAPNIKVSRTGYKEVDLMSYEAKNVKFGSSLHYRPWGNDRLEIIWNSKIGLGNTIYQGQNRYNIGNFFMEQHKLEFRGKNFFLRGYYTEEDAGDSYDTRFAAININRKWKSDKKWFQDYIQAYAGLIPGVAFGDHSKARTYADTGRFKPGSPEFKKAFKEVIADPDFSKGAKFQDQTSLYHVDGNLNLQDYIDWAEIQVGGSYRQYLLNSGGTIFTDYNEIIKYDEFGVYTQLQKKFLEDDRLKFTGSVRYDKAKNFEGNVSPRISLAYAAGENKNHNFRASFQTGFRNPTTQDQYIGLNTGAGYLLGTAPDNLDRYITNSRSVSKDGQDIVGSNTITVKGRDAFENAFSVRSIEKYNEAVKTDISNGVNPDVAAAKNLGLIKKSDFNLVKPEKVVSYEVGYRGALPLGNNKLGVDFSAYYNDYKDFIAIKNVAVPYYGKAGVKGVEGQLALAALKREDYAGFGFRTNSEADITSYGVGIALSTKVFNGFNVSMNYTWSKFSFDKTSDPDFEPAFNTPEHKVKLQFGNPNVFENFGFNINLRWQNEFYWQNSFLEGIVDKRTTIDAQINYKIPSIKSVFKVGGANLTGQEYLSAPGVGAIGSQYYISWIINN